jgi:hypothetical protein
MMGYMALIAHCVNCGRLFSSNPHRVPSFKGEPICRDCIVMINEERHRRGLETWPVSADAYEAVDEYEM